MRKNRAKKQNVKQELYVCTSGIFILVFFCCFCLLRSEQKLNEHDVMLICDLSEFTRKKGSVFDGADEKKGMP